MPGAAGIARRGWRRSAVRPASRSASMAPRSVTSAARRESGGRRTTRPRSARRAGAGCSVWTSARRRFWSARRAMGSGSMRRCSSGCARSGSRRPRSFSAWCRERQAAARDGALPAVPPLRQDDEPRQLREAVRGGDRRLPRARHFPRRGRAPSDRHVHPGWRSRTARARRQIEELRERRSGPSCMEARTQGRVLDPQWPAPGRRRPPAADGAWQSPT